MPPDLRKHVRYPELLLELQAAVYGLYHMTEPEVFYNREDLWTRGEPKSASTAQREQATQTMEPNFVLMKLPGEKATGVHRDPAVHAGEPQQPDRLDCRAQRRRRTTARRSSTTFPKTRLVDGPLQIEARIDQNAQLSGQLSLWNQQGSHVRRGALIVIPIGRALLYAEPIYLQAERSPMPELRLVVLALQDRLAYGPTFEAALAALFGGATSSTLTAAAASSARHPAAARRRRQRRRDRRRAPIDQSTLIAEAARDLADYQRLTAEGKLGEAGQKLEALKQKLERLNSSRR